MKEYIILGCLVALIISASQFFSQCSKPKIVLPDNPVISVTPITNSMKIRDLKITLPNKEEPKIVVTVPTPVPVLGKKVTSHVVVSNKGNTYVAYTEKVDIGFRFEPKLAVGYSNNVCFGVGATIFKVWRFETDALLFYELDDDIRLGIGESYQLTPNTSIGITFSENINLQPAIGVYLSLKF
jgi:hypothetical protein